MTLPIRKTGRDWSEERPELLLSGELRVPVVPLRVPAEPLIGDGVDVPAAPLVDGLVGLGCCAYPAGINIAAAAKTIGKFAEIGLFMRAPQVM